MVWALSIVPPCSSLKMEWLLEQQGGVLAQSRADAGVLPLPLGAAVLWGLHCSPSLQAVLIGACCADAPNRSTAHLVREQLS